MAVIISSETHFFCSKKKKSTKIKVYPKRSCFFTQLYTASVFTVSQNLCILELFKLPTKQVFQCYLKGEAPNKQDQTKEKKKRVNSILGVIISQHASAAKALSFFKDINEGENMSFSDFGSLFSKLDHKKYIVNFT